MPPVCEPSWKDSPSIYPPAEEIAKAMQDLGKTVDVTKNGKVTKQQKFPNVEKLCKKVVDNIRDVFNKPVYLTKNQVRAKAKLSMYVFLQRKAKTITETDPFFHAYGKDGDVYLITNDPRHCGLDVAVKLFQDHLFTQHNTKNASRTMNDALRLASIMLEQKHRDSVSLLMTNSRKKRKQNDQTGNITVALFEKMLEDFMNPEYEAVLPAAAYYNEFPEDEKGDWDANHHDIFQQQRDATWLKGTWELYLKKRYKSSLDRWNKDTGGGDGSPALFIDYCGNDRWLVVVFCKDRDCNYLLASNAAGCMPAGYQCKESGFELPASANTPDTKKRERENSPQAAKSTQGKIDDALDSVTKYLKRKEAAASPLRASAASAAASAAVTSTEDIKEVTRLSHMLIHQEVLNSMTPKTKRVYMKEARKKRKALVAKMSARHDADSDDSGGDDGFALDSNGP